LFVNETGLSRTTVALVRRDVRDVDRGENLTTRGFKR